MDRYGIPKDCWDGIISCLKRNPKVKGVILFGSRCKGNFKAGSDIDLALDGSDLTMRDIIPLSVELDELDLPWTIDLVSLATVHDPALLGHIQRCGITVG
jgi:predicted nucleotidyltransferase